MVLKASCLLLAAVSLLARHATGAGPLPTFPLPAHWSDYPNENLQPARNNKPLTDAIWADYFKRYKQECPDEATKATVAVAPVSLGTLGQGFMVIGRSSCFCGATGNCDQAVYFLENGRFRGVSLGTGWTFSVVRSRTAIPDLVLMGNSSSVSGGAGLYRFRNGTYTVIACDFVELKDGDDITNPKDVTIRRC